MRIINDRLAVCASTGLAAGAFLLGYQEVHVDFDPAQVRQEQVDACAPHIPAVKHTVSVELPTECKFAANELTGQMSTDASGEPLYDIPAREDFINRFSPGKNYNRNQHIKWATASAFWAAAVTGASVLMVNEFFPKNGGGGQPKSPELATTKTPPVRRRESRRTKLGTELPPPDNLSRRALHELAMQHLPEYRAAQRNKWLTD